MVILQAAVRDDLKNSILVDMIVRRMNSTQSFQLSGSKYNSTKESIQMELDVLVLEFFDRQLVPFTERNNK
jgi:hypothetical protein